MGAEMSNTDLPPGAVLLPEKAAPPSGLPPGAILLEDPYRKAAVEEQARLPAPGVVSDYTRRLTQGLGANWTDEALAGMVTPLEMVKRGTLDPREAYNYAKARENLILEGARERTGTTGSGAGTTGSMAPTGATGSRSGSGSGYGY